MNALHEMWIRFVEDLQKDYPNGWTLDVMKQMDWHGAQIEVKRSANPQIVGVRGIVFGCTDLELWVMDESQKRWKVDKRGLFDLIIGSQRIELDGSLIFKESIVVGRKKQRKRSRHITKCFQNSSVSRRPVLKFL